MTHSGMLLAQTATRSPGWRFERQRPGVARTDNQQPTVWPALWCAGVPTRTYGAGDGTRTRYLNLGKVALCQVSYSRSDSQEFSVHAGRHLAA